MTQEHPAGTTENMKEGTRADHPLIGTGVTLQRVTRWLRTGVRWGRGAQVMTDREQVRT